MFELQQAGRIDAFDEAAKNFMKSKDERAKILADLEATVAGESDPKHKKSGEYYIKVMKKVSEKGEGYPQTQFDRLTKMLGGAMSAEKMDSMFRRKNILSQFIKQKDEL